MSGDGVLHPTRVVGRFFRGQPIDFSGKPNLLDAAIARAKSSTVLPSLCTIGPVEGVAASVVEDEVVSAYGKTSGFTKGVVAETDVEILVSYPGKRHALFINQISVRPLLPRKSFSQHGDSGALLVDRSRRAVALLFAGSAELSWATPITTVVAELGIVFP